MDAMKDIVMELGNLDMARWIPIAVSVVTVLVTIAVTSAGLSFARSRLRALALEEAMRKQGVPIVPGRTFMEGHAGIMRKVNMAAQAMPQDPNEPHNIYPRVLAFQYQNSQKYGKNHVYWRGDEVTLHTQDPAILKDIMVTKFSDFEKSYLQIKQLEDLVGKCGLTTAGGQTWAHQRKIVNPAFHLEKLKGLVPAMVQSAEEFMESWVKTIDEGGSAEVEVSSTVSQITGDVISRTAFGSTYEKGKLFFEKIMDVIISTGLRGHKITIPGYSILPTAHNRKIWKVLREIKQILEEIVSDARRERVKLSDQVSYGNDLLGIMMAACEEMEPSKRLSNEELMDEVKTFYFGGQDTTSIMVTWALMFLATHQDWQEKAFHEVHTVCEGKPLDYDMLNRLKIIGNILYESLRLYSPAAWLQRQAQRDVQVGNFLIPKGLTILMNLTAMHTDKELWGPDAFEFRPERFANGVTNACKHPMAFAAFNSGPRNCVGQTFALLEGKVILASILRKFKFTISPKYKHQPTVFLSVKPQNGLPLIMSKR